MPCLSSSVTKGSLGGSMIRLAPRPLLVVEIQITPGVEPSGSNSDLDHAAAGGEPYQDCPPAGFLSSHWVNQIASKGKSRCPLPQERSRAPS